MNRFKAWLKRVSWIDILTWLFCFILLSLALMKKCSPEFKPKKESSPVMLYIEPADQPGIIADYNDTLVRRGQ